LNLRPNLLIVGFQKCGSSSLFDLLCQHPNIRGTAPKETFFLADESYENYNLEVAWQQPGFLWEKLYAPEKEEVESAYCLEASVCNFYQQTALDFATRFDDTKIIFVLRDPIDRFVSTYKYYGATGVHVDPTMSIRDYYFAVREGKIHTKEGIQYALEHGRYHRYINAWKDKIDNDRILILGMKKMIRSVDQTLEEVCNFLRIPHESANVKLRHMNKSRPHRYKRLNRFLVSLFGGSGLGGTRMGKWYANLQKGQQEEVGLDEKLRAELLEYYKEEYQIYGRYF